MGQDLVQGPCRQNQHGPAAARLPQAVAAVPQGCQLRRPAPYAHPHCQQLAPHAVAGRRPEYNRQQQIGPGGSYEQHLGVHIRVENAVHRRHGAACHHSQGHHAACQGPGKAKEQRRQPAQVLLSAKGRQGQQHPCRRLGRRGRQKAQSRQEYRRRVAPAQGRRQRIPPPPQGHPGQPGRHQTEEIVHQSVEKKHAVQIDHRHVSALLSGGSSPIIGQAPGKSRRKKEAPRIPPKSAHAPSPRRRNLWVQTPWVLFDKTRPAVSNGGPLSVIPYRLPSQ